MGLFTKNTYVKSSPSKPKLIIITGCAGSGKTTIGREMARQLQCVYIDKDTVTRAFTDYVLVYAGSHSGDRESEFYRQNLLSVEYDIAFKVCKENLELGNDVVLTIPFISQIQEYQKWQKIKNNAGLNSIPFTEKFIWIIHDIYREHERVLERNAERDGNKIKNWDEYAASVDGIKPAKEYQAWEIHNDMRIELEKLVKEILDKWIKK